ncbi:MAG: macrocin O-methyltransferase [Cyanobacteria bacterium J083]|nr:MAG: macrocin O-methyltransferase [Cyanobacteria bacterium J083]
MNEAKALYLDLMKKCLTNTIYRDHGYVKRQISQFDSDVRQEGKDWPTVAHTMIGRKRLDNLQSCVEDVLRQGVPGDLIETGVWRGGATILMRAILKVYDAADRYVWVADSFAGLPEPNEEKYPADAKDRHHTYKQLAISLEEVKSNFRVYGLLDEQVRFLKGWFKDTLPTAEIEQLAVIRLDGDMYESTMDGLVNLYPKLAVGGYLIVDDYGAVPACRQAIDDYRQKYNITEEILPVDWTGVFWQKT